MNKTSEMQFEEQAGKLELALNRKGAKLSVKLSNVGNPDHGQDPRRPLPETTVGWAHVDTIKEAVELCLLYVSFYDLGGGNWNGGLITRNEDGLAIGRVGYNGRVWSDEHRTPKPANSRWENQCANGSQNKLPPSTDRRKLRSKTHPGLAEAMAEQWGQA